MSEKNQLQVEAIRHGSVIDHVPAGQGIKILKLFQLIETQERITVGFNLKSGALGKKDLIKIENTRLTEQQANQLALFAPAATVNIIEDFAVVKKHQLKLPEFIAYGLPNVDAGKLVPEKYQPELPTTPANLEGAIALDVDFWTDNSEELTQRFNAWLAQ